MAFIFTSTNVVPNQDLLYTKNDAFIFHDGDAIRRIYLLFHNLK